jgi:hypothetical protein
MPQFDLNKTWGWTLEMLTDHLVFSRQIEPSASKQGQLASAISKVNASRFLQERVSNHQKKMRQRLVIAPTTHANLN